MNEAQAPIEVFVKSVTYEAVDICSYDLRPVKGRVLPDFTSGSHIDLLLPNGMVRNYSLCNAPAGECERYVVAVAKDRASRGGSQWIHESLRAGARLFIQGPRNYFPLHDSAPHSVFIAGGIGITPLWSMIQHLERLGRSWELYFSARTRQHAAFEEAIRQLPHADRRVHFNFDQEPGGSMLDLQAVVGSAPADAHLYCCGPAPMLKAFESAAHARPPENIHLEYFASDAPASREGEFTVVLAKSGRELDVPKGKSILDVVLAAGLKAQFSCMEGVCSSCEVAVVEGIPDHRDMVLSKKDRAANKTMMICVSGSKTPRLVIDL